MWWFRWHARRFFRSVMNPIPEEVAILWTNRLRFLYVFIGFNAMIVSYLFVYKNKAQRMKEGMIEDPTLAHRKVRLMNMGDYTIVRLGPDRPMEKIKINSHEYGLEYKERVRKAQLEREVLLKKKNNESIGEDLVNDSSVESNEQMI